MVFTALNQKVVQLNWIPVNELVLLMKLVSLLFLKNLQFCIESCKIIQMVFTALNQKVVQLNWIPVNEIGFADEISFNAFFENFKINQKFCEFFFINPYFS